MNQKLVQKVVSKWENWTTSSSFCIFTQNHHYSIIFNTFL